MSVYPSAAALCLETEQNVCDASDFSRHYLFAMLQKSNAGNTFSTCLYTKQFTMLI